MAQCHVAEEDIPGAIHIAIKRHMARRTLEPLVPSQLLVDETATTAGLRGEILITDHHTTLRILADLVQQTLLEAVVRPGIHCTCNLPVDFPGLVSRPILCHRMEKGQSLAFWMWWRKLSFSFELRWT